MNGLIIERIFDLDHIAAYVIATLLIAVFVLLFYSFVYRFREVDAKILGVVLNKMNLTGKGYYGKYYGKYYGRYYGKYYGKYYGNYGNEEE